MLKQQTLKGPNIWLDEGIKENSYKPNVPEQFGELARIFH